MFYINSEQFILGWWRQTQGSKRVQGSVGSFLTIYGRGLVLGCIQHLLESLCQKDNGVNDDITMRSYSAGQWANEVERSHLD